MPLSPESNDVKVSPRQGRGCLFWVLRGLLIIVIGMAALVIVAVTYQAVSAQADSTSYPPPGELVDIGGYRLHIHCIGAGAPAVILEAGAGGMSPMWGWIQTQVAPATRVCAYDRAGFGWSDVGPQPRDAQQIVTELHQLLNEASIEPPYILVGHSFGGGLVRLYTEQYPDEIVGLVLVDSRHPDQMQRIPELLADVELGRELNSMGELVAPFGLMRLYWGEDGPNPDLPAPHKDEMRTFYATARLYRTQLDEDAVITESDAQVRATGDLGSLPLIVISGDSSGTWMNLQEELSTLSSNGQWRVVQNSTHNSLLTDPQHAAEVSTAVQELVESSR